MARNIAIDTTGNKRRCRRRQGEIAYPITYCNQMADFDIWDHMFFSSHFDNLTVHQFSKPPSVVLDLGCGTGYWVIEAAKQWRNSRIYGFDIAKIQPQLEQMEQYKTLAPNIEWVHGNFLDGLSFPPNYFDFVRIAKLGLAIPEDEWQAVLEDIHRVMRPSAVLEIIEEDLLFPCPSALLQTPAQLSSPSSPAGSFHSRSPELHKSKSTMFYQRPSKSSERFSPASSSNHDNMFPSRMPTFLPPFSEMSSTGTLILSSASSTETASETEHPQDHTRIKESWEAMLATRFLSPNLLSVLPFYLTTSSFVDTKKHPPLVAPLPPNSGSIPQLKTYRSLGFLRTTASFSDSIYDFAPTFSSKSSMIDGFTFRSSIPSIHRPAAAWSTMHLAKTVSTIRGCKEAIWEEYKKLYSNDALYLLSRTAPDEEDYISQPKKHVARKAFEVDWMNWECDMIDRMDSERDRPHWRTWRAKLDRKSGSDLNSGHLVTANNPDDSCRSLRVFTGFKA